MPAVSRGMMLDPVRFAKTYWPQYDLYDKQREMVYSVRDNDETIVVSSNMGGKDFGAALTALYFLLTRWPCRIITTSVKDQHLIVLWGEIGRFIQTSAVPLLAKDGGPLVVNHREIRHVVNGQVCKISYLLGMVSEKGEGMAGHHAEHTLLILDEASGIDDVTYTQGCTWAKKVLAFGNPNACNNFFKAAVKGGDIPRKDKPGLYRKVIRITAQDSPNVALGLEQQAKGKVPTGEVVTPGVLTWDEYQKRLATWNVIQRTVGLDACFYEGAEVLMFPSEWLDHSAALALRLRDTRRQAKAIGLDPAEGGDSTSMCAVDELGVIELVSKKTPDTNVIPGELIAFGRKHAVPPECWIIDRGNGGKVHADALRARGFACRTVAFGEAVSDDPRHGKTPVSQRLDQKEERYAYKNRRAQMYGDLRERMDPSGPCGGFAIPRGGAYDELRRQLAPIPLQYDGEGRMVLPPKSKKNKDSKEVTLTELIGHSPDEADAVVLSLHSILHTKKRITAGAGRSDR